MDSSHSIQAWVGNLFSAGAIIATLAGWVPVIAAIIGAIWYLIRIYESSTVQRWRAARRTRKIARLQARLAALQVRQGLEPPAD